MSKQIYFDGTLGNAVDTAYFLILVSVLLSIIMWVLLIILDAIFPSKSQGFSGKQSAGSIPTKPAWFLDKFKEVARM